MAAKTRCEMLIVHAKLLFFILLSNLRVLRIIQNIACNSCSAAVYVATNNNSLGLF